MSAFTNTSHYHVFKAIQVWHEGEWMMAEFSFLSELFRQSLKYSHFDHQSGQLLQFILEKGFDPWWKIKSDLKIDRLSRAFRAPLRIPPSFPVFHTHVLKYRQRDILLSLLRERLTANPSNGIATFVLCGAFTDKKAFHESLLIIKRW